MRKVLSRKMVLITVLFLWVAVVRVLSGCSGKEEDLGKVRDLEFTVIGEQEMPQELKDIIAEKQQMPFKLTYSDDVSLYIAVGYGEQPTGGYSITVNELYLTENSIVIDTELLGPDKGENGGTAASFPYIVVKTEYLDYPMVFQ